MDIANLTKYHSAIGSPNARDGHDHRVKAGDKAVSYTHLDVYKRQP